MRDIDSENPQSRNRQPETGAGIGLPRLVRPVEPAVCPRAIDEHRWSDTNRFAWKLNPSPPFGAAMRKRPAKRTTLDNAVVNQRMRAQQGVAPLPGAGARPERQRRVRPGDFCAGVRDPHGPFVGRARSPFGAQGQRPGARGARPCTGPTFEVHAITRQQLVCREGDRQCGGEQNDAAMAC